MAKPKKDEVKEEPRFIINPCERCFSKDADCVRCKGTGEEPA